VEPILSSEKCGKSGFYIWNYARARKYWWNRTHFYL